MSAKIIEIQIRRKLIFLLVSTSPLKDIFINKILLFLPAVFYSLFLYIDFYHFLYFHNFAVTFIYSLTEYIYSIIRWNVNPFFVKKIPETNRNETVTKRCLNIYLIQVLFWSTVQYLNTFQIYFTIHIYIYIPFYSINDYFLVSFF